MPDILKNVFKTSFRRWDTEQSIHCDLLLNPVVRKVSVDSLYPQLRLMFIAFNVIIWAIMAVSAGFQDVWESDLVCE